MDAGILKSFSVSIFKQGLKNMVVKEQKSQITEVFRSGMTSGRYSLAEVAEHCHHDSCWVVISDNVYDFTEFISKHPGGEEIMLEHAGHDATVAFESKGHSQLAYTMMEKYCVGKLTEEDRRFKTKDNTKETE